MHSKQVHTKANETYLQLRYVKVGVLVPYSDLNIDSRA